MLHNEDFCKSRHGAGIVQREQRFANMIVDLLQCIVIGFSISLTVLGNQRFICKAICFCDLLAFVYTSAKGGAWSELHQIALQKFR